MWSASWGAFWNASRDVLWSASWAAFWDATRDAIRDATWASPKCGPTSQHLTRRVGRHADAGSRHGTRHAARSTARRTAGAEGSPTAGRCRSPHRRCGGRRVVEGKPKPTAVLGEDDLSAGNSVDNGRRGDGTDGYTVRASSSSQGAKRGASGRLAGSEAKDRAHRRSSGIPVGTFGGCWGNHKSGANAHVACTASFAAAACANRRFHGWSGTTAIATNWIWSLHEGSAGAYNSQGRAHGPSAAAYRQTSASLDAAAWQSAARL